MNQQEFNARSKALAKIAQGVRYPLAWKVNANVSVKGWRSDTTKGEYVVHPWKTSGANRYNAEGVWALPRQEKPFKGKRHKSAGH